MDARELLRRYLEQRRELGDQELVLDGMDVEEVLRLVGAMRPGAGAPAASPPSSAAPPAARPQQADAVLPAREVEPPATPATRESRPPASTERGGHDFDWRSALRAAGGGPESGPGSRPERAVEPPAPTLPQPAPTGGATAAGSPAAAQGEEEPVPRRTTRAMPAAKADRAVGDSPPTPTPAWLEELDVPLGLVVGRGTTELLEPAFTALGTLHEVAATVAQCTRCPLYKTATHGVPGEGNPDADLVCVGEAPGEREDEQGRPFVGPSGQLLTKILAAIRLSRDEVFIANVLKHRPPGNRNPEPDEVEACSPYLLRQLELLKPKVILTLGTFASQTLLRTTTPIGKLRERVHLYHGIPLVVTYHPAALLRNPAWKRPTWNDVQLARRILDRASGA